VRSRGYSLSIWLSVCSAVLAAEMLTDLAMKAGATAVWSVAVGAVGWVLLCKYGRHPHGSQLGSEEA
jgi:hypothetical protein